METKIKTMRLTGQCKEDFFKWSEETDVSDTDLLWQWYKIPESMKFGLYVDFFDEKSNLRIVQNVTEKTFYWKVKILGDSKIKGYSGFEKTRQEARDEAIKKANEIYNLK